jgi:hypothetical protein
MLSDTDAACVAITLALCLINEKNRRWIEEWYVQTTTTVHTRKSHDQLNVELAKRLQNYYFF